MAPRGNSEIFCLAPPNAIEVDALLPVYSRRGIRRIGAAPFPGIRAIMVRGFRSISRAFPILISAGCSDSDRPEFPKRYCNMGTPEEVELGAMAAPVEVDPASHLRADSLGEIATPSP